jgi:hypothetical protein
MKDAITQLQMDASSRNINNNLIEQAETLIINDDTSRNMKNNLMG